ncbi:MAG: S-methyl-5-thioribose-1-phosphate isomerase [Coriobacteriia bacterium]|nr:S-methyl-5-thioribose-1-phosphate isomerase [Coriobacteriia bacterium]
MPSLDDIPRTIWWQDGRVMLVDQSRLPLQGDLLACNTYEGVCQAIKGMAVRGAPALGVAAALGVALWATTEGADIDDVDAFLARLDEVAAEIAATRPTAVNLAWGAERMRRFAHDNADAGLPELRDLLVQEALRIRAEDEERNRAIGAHGAEIIEPGSRILTHCNAGSLATAYYGTALGVIFAAHQQGKVEGVWVDETRPVLQGARLTAWELKLAGVPFKLITDNMAASVMRAGLVDAVIVGADRIAANGDVANKIGTYGLAVLAKEHGIPFYVAAPTSTVDLTLESGDDIVIEERDPREVLGVTASGVIEPDSATAQRAFDALTENGPYTVPIQKGHQMVIERKGAAYRFDGWFRVAPPNVEVYNPAFDVTPAEYVTAIVTERGVARAPYEESLAGVCCGSGAIHEL